MNEFGKIGIDGPVISDGDIDLVEINRGSIFCSCLQLNFVQTLADLSDRALDYVFVESSGLSDPSNIAEILEGVEMLKGDRYEFKGSLCLIDSINFNDQIEDIETVERQLKYCQLAIVNKIDRVDDDQLVKVIENVKSVNANVDVITTSFGKMAYDFLNKDLLAMNMYGNEDSLNKPENKPKTLNLTIEESVSKEAFDLFLKDILNDTYRMKGFFNLDEKWYKVDVVNKTIDYIEYESDSDTSQLVIISKIGPQIIRPIVSNWENRIDKKMKLR